MNTAGSVEELVRRTLLNLGITRFEWARKRVFKSYYARNTWRDGNSRSGGGSNLEQTAVIRVELPRLFERLDIRSLIDVPCGDGYWWGHVEHDLERYVGIDVVPELIHTQNAKAGPGCSYLCRDVATDDMPRADAILCRDLLVHFSEALGRQALQNLKRSGATYLITTTFPGRKNRDIETGRWRPIDLQAPPFNFPEPVVLINEGCTEAGGRFGDKSLGVWRFAQLELG